MKRLLRWLGSLRIAVPLLILIAGVLAWGTIYETRFGTAAVQRAVYQSWWFQALLAFLAVNLAVAAAERYPWQRRQLPFLLAHLGIILILIGGILGGRFGVDGQMIIAEGEASRTLQIPQNVLVVHQPNSGLTQVIPTHFETRAWVHEPNATFAITLKDRTVQLIADRYYPDAQLREAVTADGAEPFAAVQLELAHEDQTETLWLFADDPERFGARWGEAHALFLAPATAQEARPLLEPPSTSAHPRGVVSIRLPKENTPHDLEVPEELGRAQAIAGTRYTVTFKDYFPDFAISGQGPVSRSQEPNNPAVAFTLSGPEGADAYLLFALHPDFSMLHGRTFSIPAEVRYTHSASSALPPDTIAIIRTPPDGLAAAFTDAVVRPTVNNPIALGRSYQHPSLGYHVTVRAHYPKAKLVQQFTNRSDEVRAEMLHVVAREGDQSAEAWVGLRQTATLELGPEPLTVEYRRAERELPVTIKLTDFRKIDYPGIQMAAGFESDVQLTDHARGVILIRKISMNNPLRYGGFSFFQSSFIPGAVETTVLSARSDPGTPVVYLGFLIVIGGIISLFATRTSKPQAASRGRTRKEHRT